MVEKYYIAFREVASPIVEPVTKFGGQPVWISEPRWPISPNNGKQMEFICQVALDVLGAPPAQMAYLFMTGDEEEGYADSTWEAEGGENAVIVQAEDRNAGETPPGGPVTRPLSTGPSVRKMIENGSGNLLRPVPCEYAVELSPGEDPELVDEAEMVSWSDEAFDSYHDSLQGNKIGGTPGFVQSEEFPRGGSWRLRLQLDMETVPFYVNFGDAGVGYAFISEGGEIGKFLWQCY